MPSRPRAEQGQGGRAAEPPSLPVTRQQRDLFLDPLGQRGTGRYVEQISWHWRGPLDTGRFTAAWQSVVDRETVLRAAFAGDPEPHVVLHERAEAEVVRHLAGSVGWDELVERDRLRGFDLRDAGPLRVTLLDEPAEPAEPPDGGAGAVPDGGGGAVPDGGAGAVPPPVARRTPDASGAVTRVLLTFHHGLLDAWSVFVLIDEFYRAYLAGGALPGGERRPDMRDWFQWLGRQDPGPAREFWTRAVPPGAPAVLPAAPGPDTRESGCGRAEGRLTAAEADRLHRWAAARALPDSSALQAVWALLLYRAAGATGPAQVGFGVTVSGRGITLDAVERLPGPLRACLPMSVQVDPAHRLPQLLTGLRDRALDMAAYEWVSAGQIHEWTGRAAGGGRLLESVVAVESRPRRRAGVRGELAAGGVRVDPPRASGAHTAFPVALFAHREPNGALTLSALHDRARISADDAGRLVGHCVRLLKELPRTDERTTVADVLATLAGHALPRIAAPPRRRADRPHPAVLDRRASGRRADSEPFLTPWGDTP
ncbi:condensation domain-containing protein [Streptomyces sp. A0958]|uniref:condensation domain-containing protein n=1 Tax=Streptomyces sp. A0958 TaxID=2563101 RepID=UPI001F105273|nr:condensation domain-containing protein [Streptomyces sp. A0958]